ncbi:hypothetical protein [Bradyrhizobium erythrophlei]|uniref:hypothetical protein n=1 Tax=Bradyrhizobium erythrophlei TaxID=1437360 RepID=UPI0012EC5786|nr:hypothetical protein [Bradyrhizobium erythrophlei]
MSDFENFLETWCTKNLSHFENGFDEIEHFHAPRAERLRAEAYEAGFGTAITQLGHVSEGGLVGYVKRCYETLEFQRGRLR